MESDSPKIELTVNDEQIRIPAGSGIQTLIELYQLSSDKGVAISINQEVVNRSQWNEVVLKSGDDVLLIIATQGG